MAAVLLLLLRLWVYLIEETMSCNKPPSLPLAGSEFRVCRAGLNAKSG